MLSRRPYQVKRVMDVVVAALALIILSPILFICVLLMRVNLGTPILFRQRRPGLHGKPFTLLKFRTMREVFDDSGRAHPDSERLTRFGSFLRSTSLDELPELLNVLRGEMSLVGPRPLLMEYLDRYDSEQMRRHDVRPGITGWAQVNGRNTLTWEEKFRLDVWYVDHVSLWLDIRILVMTIWKVLSQDGINAPGEATMQEFLGTQSEE